MDVSIRVIALIDMDAFFTQVEEREKPHFRGRPLAVVPFSRGTAITGQSIAVNYPARAFGIKRGMDCNEMRSLCPIIQLCRVPAIDGVEKGDISKYRDASGEIFKVLVAFSEHIVVEKASIDEAFLDLTEECERELESCSAEEWVEKLNADAADLLPTTFLVNESDKQQTTVAMERLNCLKKWLGTDCRLSRQQLAIAIGATIVERIRKRVKEATQFNCSAGIGHNKILAKLVCARHKPACQSIILPQNTQQLYQQTPINSVRNLGGKFGRRLMRHFDAKVMAELRDIPRDVLLKHFHAKNVDWLTQLLAGENDEPVCSNLQPKSLGTSKNFPGANMLTTISSVKKWVQALANELSKRLNADDDKYGRVAQTLVIGFSTGIGEHNVHTMHLPNYTAAAIQQTCWNFMKPFNREKDGQSWYPHVSCMYMSASRFETIGRPTKRITDFFHREIQGSNDDDDVIFLDKINNLQAECDVGSRALLDHVVVSGDEGAQHAEVPATGTAEDEIVILENRKSTSNANDTVMDNDDRRTTNAVVRKQRKNAINFASVHHRRRRRSLTRRITEFFRQDFGCVVVQASTNCGADAEIVVLEDINLSSNDMTTDRQQKCTSRENFVTKRRYDDGFEDTENQENTATIIFFNGETGVPKPYKTIGWVFDVVDKGRKFCSNGIVTSEIQAVEAHFFDDSNQQENNEEAVPRWEMPIVRRPRFEVPFWNVFDRAQSQIEKTNNAMESAHKHFAKELNHHPSLSDFLHIFMEDVDKQNDIARSATMHNTRIRRKQYVVKEEAIAQIHQEADFDGDRGLMDALFLLGLKLQGYVGGLHMRREQSDEDSTGDSD